MALIGWLWLASPFAVIGLISHDRELLAVVSAHHHRARAIGWTGVVITLLSVAVVPGWAGWMMYLIGLPVAGLVVWGLRDDGDGGGGSAPDLPPINWGEFERSFSEYVRRRGGRSPRPRVPSAR
jgi:hypothetical protein